MGVKQRITDKEVIQKRAVETREKLLVAALDMYIEQGYHNTTVDEIAKHAGLSTGIAYRYFKNKKELLLKTLEFAFANIGDMVGVSEKDFIGGNLSKAIKAFERIHVEYRDFHEELEGLRHSDGDVRKMYDDFTEAALRHLHESLPEQIKNKPHSWENLNIVIGMMENYCHAYMDKRMSTGELKYMRKKTLDMVEYIMKEDAK